MGLEPVQDGDSVLNTARWSFGPLLQVVALAIGLSWSIRLIARLAAEEPPTNRLWRKTVPLVAFSLAYSLGMLWLLVG
jgi:hypothetical protein